MFAAHRIAAEHCARAALSLAHALRLFRTSKEAQPEAALRLPRTWRRFGNIIKNRLIYVL